jgi:hypothetical protein
VVERSKDRVSQPTQIAEAHKLMEDNAAGGKIGCGYLKNTIVGFSLHWLIIILDGTPND